MIKFLVIFSILILGVTSQDQEERESVTNLEPKTRIFRNNAQTIGECVRKCPSMRQKVYMTINGPHDDCDKWCVCMGLLGGYQIVRQCPENTHYSEALERCVEPEKAQCYNKFDKCKGNCTMYRDGTFKESFVAHEDCANFCECKKSNGRMKMHYCAEGFHFSVENGYCMRPEDAKCQIEANFGENSSNSDGEGDESNEVNDIPEENVGSNEITSNEDNNVSESNSNEENYNGNEVNSTEENIEAAESNFGEENYNLNNELNSNEEKDDKNEINSTEDNIEGTEANSSNETNNWNNESNFNEEKDAENEINSTEKNIEMAETNFSEEKDDENEINSTEEKIEGAEPNSSKKNNKLNNESNSNEEKDEESEINSPKEKIEDIEPNSSKKSDKLINESNSNEENNNENEINSTKENIEASESNLNENANSLNNQSNSNEEMKEPKPTEDNNELNVIENNEIDEFDNDSDFTEETKHEARNYSIEKQNNDGCVENCPSDYSSKSYYMKNVNCKKYCVCKNGTRIVENCPAGLYFDGMNRQCVVAKYSKCENTEDLSVQSTTEKKPDNAVFNSSEAATRNNSGDFPPPNAPWNEDEEDNE